MLSFVSGDKTVDPSEVEVMDTILFNSARKFSATRVRIETRGRGKGEKERKGRREEESE
jgi:hypothetical protein